MNTVNVNVVKRALSSLTYAEMQHVADRIYDLANLLDQRDIADALSEFANEEWDE